MWILAVSLLLLATTHANSKDNTATPSLSAALNADGTIHAGVQGSFDASGYTIGTAPNGRPTFQPSTQKLFGVQGAGDASWSTAFGVGSIDDYVYALAVDGGGNIYAGGSFTTAGGASANHIAKWNGSTWSALGTGLNGDVRSLAIDASGTVYAGGTFISAGTITVNNLAKWNGTSWSAVGTGTNGSVLALAIDSRGIVYAGGTFTTAGGIAADYLAQWNGTTWSNVGSSGSGPQGYVRAIAIDGTNNLYVGGDFYSIGSPQFQIASVAKWNGSTWTALGSAPTVYNNSIRALAIDSNGNLYAGGYFKKIGNGINANNIAKWTGSTWVALGDGINTGANSGNVNALSVDSNGNVYVAGRFTSAGTELTSCIAKWNGSTWSSLGSGITLADTNIETAVYALTTDASANLYAGGLFGTINGLVAENIGKWTSSASIWSRLGPPTAPSKGANGPVYSILVDKNDNVYVGGLFTSIGGVAATCVAKWDGTTWAALGSGTKGSVVCLAIDNQGNLFAGGAFIVAGETIANRIAKWNGTTWSALGQGSPIQIDALAIDASGAVYAGGSFSYINGGTPANNIAKWNGSTWSALGAGLAGTVNSLVIDTNGSLYAGGNFGQSGSLPDISIAKWNGTTWSAFAVGTGIVHELAVDKANNIYAAGRFNDIGGIAAASIAKWDGSSWLPLGAGLKGTGIANIATATALAVNSKGDVYVAGNITSAGGVAVNKVARWNGSVWSSLGTGTNNTVVALAVNSAGNLYAGGNFTAVGDGSRFMAHLGYYTNTPLTLDTDSPLINVRVFPNPARNKVTVTIPTLPGSSYATITLMDAIGRVISVNKVALSANPMHYILETSGLAEAQYVVRIQVGTTSTIRHLWIR